MDWWVQVLTTCAGAIIGGSVVIASDVMRHRANRQTAAEDRRHEAEEARERWHRDRQAMRNDDQRRWILELQDAVLRYTRLNSRAIQHDLAHHREHPDDRYPSSLLGEGLDLELFEAEGRVSVLNARISDEQLRELVAELRALCARVTTPGAAAAEADALLKGGFSQPPNAIQLRVTELLREL